jgi:hypothetical protein
MAIAVVTVVLQETLAPGFELHIVRCGHARAQQSDGALGSEGPEPGDRQGVQAFGLADPVQRGDQIRRGIQEGAVEVEQDRVDSLHGADFSAWTR